ncbi:vegetative incompatibility protein HET-E-1 [Cadophora sp. DSE1049]|nr:vegetative incompatibility protein HET-E-1 [Cadophora sp. DSE1049]
MRLLQSDDDGNLSLTEFFECAIPNYAILSHRWGTDEVAFKDLADGTSKSKAGGYSKIQFCGEQARRDGLKYFWVDTCCIDKSSSAELSEAINSMFRWYQKAARCYVYLSDVSTLKRKASDTSAECTWESAFRASEWFTRGWTLQELLAPRSVEFFSREGNGLGSKRTLERQIHEITGIPATALRENPLSQFNIDERFSWAKSRQTTRGEDKAYSLFGIFDIQMPLLYGEGEVKAFQRLRETIEKPLKEQKVVLSKLRFAGNATFDSHDEEHNTRCYQGTRVELLRHIESWAGDLHSKCVFWLNGMAGTGKSTISRTIAQKFDDKRELGASFFFKRGEGDRRDAGMFIETIVTQLVQKIPSLAPHVQKAIEDDPGISRKALKLQFETLVLQPFRKLQADPQKSSTAVIVIDALDECDQEEDIGIIIRLLPQVQCITSVQLKFFLTSRPELPIRLGFEDVNGKYEALALHQIPESVIKEDISTFLEHDLATIRRVYNKSVLPNRQLPVNWPGQRNVQVLVDMATPLFIFAATVCRFIRDRRCGQPNEQLTKVLKYHTPSQASKLDATYLPVLNQLLFGVTASEKRSIVEGFKKVIGSIVILVSPLSATSLDRLLGVDEGTVASRTDLLHSVLNIPSRPDHPIRLFHLSFRDFLVDAEKCKTNPFWVDETQAHQRIAEHCIRLMLSFLKQDLCDLKAPGVLVTDVERSWVNQFISPEVQYACLYWVQHLQKSCSQAYDGEIAHRFLQAHLLHWLEALGWMGKISEGIQAILSLEAHVSATEDPDFYAFIYDIKRFVLYNRSAIEKAPLQLYCSALVFAPKNSIVRRNFEGCIPDWIQLKPKVQVNWNAALQALEGHTNAVTSVAFSSDGKQVVSGSVDETVRLWDAATGAALQMLEGHTSEVTSVAFSPDGKQVVSGSYDKTVRLWDVAAGAALQTLEGHTDEVTSVAFSPDGKQVVSGSYDRTVRLWDATTGTALQTLEGHTGGAYSVAFSPDGKQVVSGSVDETVRLWDAATGAALQTLEDHTRMVTSVAFSSSEKQVVSGSYDETVRLWDAATGAALQMLEGHTSEVTSVAFSPDGKQVVSGSNDETVRLWDAATGAALQTLEGHTGWVNSVAFSPDSKQVVSGSVDETVRLWDAATGSALQMLEGHTDGITSMAFSSDGKQVVSGSYDETVRLWDAATGAALQTLEGHTGVVYSVAFSPDGKQVVSGSVDETVRLWDAVTGAALQMLEGHTSEVTSVAFSPDGKQVVSGSYDQTVWFWDAATGAPLQMIEGQNTDDVSFSLKDKLPPILQVSDHWVVESDTTILWLPPDYREHKSASWNRNLVLGHSSGRISFFCFKTAAKLVI